MWQETLWQTTCEEIKVSDRGKKCDKKYNKTFVTKICDEKIRWKKYGDTIKFVTKIVVKKLYQKFFDETILWWKSWLEKNSD